jgi:1-acyl-sn-glycerol-3-phosphate acyltransferase
LFSAIYIPVACMITTPVALIAGRRTGLRLTRWFIRVYGISVVGLAFPWIRVELRHRTNIPVDRPCVFISNHQSIADIFLMARLPKQECVFVSNRWPFKIPVLGYFAKVAGYLSITSMRPKEFFEQAALLFSQNVSIISFPEGTRTRTGALGPFHTTVFKLAQRNGVPIVPVCIEGNFRLIPPGSAMLRPGTVRMHILPAIEAGDYEALTPYQLKRKARARVAHELNCMEGAAA